MSELEPQNDEQRSPAAKPEARAETPTHDSPADHAGVSGNGSSSVDYGADKIKVLEGLEAVR